MVTRKKEKVDAGSSRPVLQSDARSSARDASAEVAARAKGILTRDKETLQVLHRNVVEFPLRAELSKVRGSGESVAASGRPYPERGGRQVAAKELPKLPTLLPHWESKLAIKHGFSWRDLSVDTHQLSSVRRLDEPSAPNPWSMRVEVAGPARPVR
eukprot:gnl/MRDRNA2_/MRDRNA2_99849_c0_seq1.p1 gnl/MRDRNA2_/MRDRNA2_99849_c0~~gnl/MRDRNA2_/MRDRNA2_99849_c0_seq1.p1  ORF type:complete len:156 (+),score=27.37 gnl/MRDRNA2_/MRDRNA2_99849_c0_seq1:45-512(+)